MNKQELIQTHQLLALVKDDATEKGIDVETPEYEDDCVGPNAIHKSKTAHKDSILTLANEIADAFENADFEESTDESPVEESQTEKPDWGKISN